LNSVYKPADVILIDKDYCIASLKFVKMKSKEWSSVRSLISSLQLGISESE